MPTKTRKKSGKKPAAKRIDLEAVIDALTGKPAIVTKAISESTGQIKTGRYEP